MQMIRGKNKTSDDINYFSTMLLAIVCFFPIYNMKPPAVRQLIESSQYIPNKPFLYLSFENTYAQNEDCVPLLNAHKHGIF